MPKPTPPVVHAPIWRVRAPAGSPQARYCNDWRYLDRDPRDGINRMEVEPVTASMLVDIVAEAQEAGRAELWSELKTELSAKFLAALLSNPKRVKNLHGLDLNKVACGYRGHALEELVQLARAAADQLMRAEMRERKT